jgi:hypothetical protein
MRARVAWSGVGIDLATNEPTPQALREAVRTVLENPTYRGRASSIADEFGGIDTRSEILWILDQLSHAQKEDGLRRNDTIAPARRASAVVRSPVPEVTIVTQPARYRNRFVFLQL